MSLLADLRIWGIVALISGVGVGTALIPFFAGRHGLEAVLIRFPQLKAEHLEQVQTLYQQHGSGLLFFSFLPVLGVLLTAGAGVAGIQISRFVLWVLAGRVLRNSILWVLVAQGLYVVGVQ